VLAVDVADESGVARTWSAVLDALQRRGEAVGDLACLLGMASPMPTR
jgi:hypothetical protein